MRVTSTLITKLTIDEVPGLDPIHVFLEDDGKGRGRLTVNCFSSAWATYWGAMGDRSLAEFIVDMDAEYIVDRLCNMPSRIAFTDDVPEAARAVIRQIRRTGEITQSEARALYEETDCYLTEGEIEEKMVRIAGDSWKGLIPMVDNPEYAYLRRIVEVIQDACKAQLTDADAAPAAA